MTLSGWGRYPRITGTIARPRTHADVPSFIIQSSSVIARGNGRAYGDAAMNAACTLEMRRAERLISFDADSGLLVCESGTLLSEVIDIFLPRGWFVPVTPGTRFVTIGGMLAADVHGKNHHIGGSFGHHVVWFDIALADGRVVRCSQGENLALFNATVGGMGLTGVILVVAFHLMRVETDLIRQTLLKAAHLEEAMDLFEAHSGATYSVAWIDCVAQGDRLGRSLIMLGEHVPADELPVHRRGRAFGWPQAKRVNVPIDFPSIALNRYSIGAFNALYFGLGKPGISDIGLSPYFYPLDAIGAWNRIYGRNGFVQYQFVLPMESSRAGMRKILTRIAEAGSGSFLAVLKLFGSVAVRPGSLSFPREGYTLALDFPATITTLNLLLELDALVTGHGGRLYLAKDARSGAATMAGYGELDTFRAVRAEVDPYRRFSSLLSQRLGL